MASYIQVFGGSTLYPAEVSYRSVSIASSITLQWPVETQPGSQVVSKIMDVSATSPGISITLPDTRVASVGETILFVNVGALGFTVRTNDGSVLQTIAPSTSYQLYLRDNTTAAGNWGIVLTGSSLSAVSAANLATEGLAAITPSSVSTIGLIPRFNPQATTIAPAGFTGANWGSVYNWTGGSGAITLPAASTLPIGWYIIFRNSGTGGLDLNTQTNVFINGSNRLTLQPNDSCILLTDTQSSYYTVGFGQDTQFAFSYISIGLSNTTDAYSLSAQENNKISYSFTGTLNVTSKQVILPSYPQQYWMTNNTTGGTSGSTGTLIFKTATTGAATVSLFQGQSAILFCDNQGNILRAESALLPPVLPVAQGGTGADNVAGALSNLGGGAAGISVFQNATNAGILNAIGAATTTDVLSLSIVFS